MFPCPKPIKKTQFDPLFCKVGDVLEIKEEITTTPWPGEISEVVEKGALYKAIGLVGFRWDLNLVEGNGPIHLRILNSNMTRYTRIIKAA